MGVRYPSVQTNVVLTATITTNVELLVATTPPLNIPLDFATIYILCTMGIGNAGASTTAMTLRIRQGATLAGGVVSASFSVPVTAAGNMILSTITFDTPGAVAGMQYTASVQQTGASGNGTVGSVALMAFAL